MPCGGGVGAGPFHSQTNEAWFTHTPGLKVVYPAFPSDAKGLLLRSIEDPKPVMFFEHKALYRSISDSVPDDYYTIPFGKANVVNTGDDLSIITYGMGVYWSLSAEKQFSGKIEIIDLRTLYPLDEEMIYNSVKSHNRCMIVTEEPRENSFALALSGKIQ